MRIAILDSGVNAKLPVFRNIALQSYLVSENGNVEPGGNDTYGHGTAIAAILAQEIPQAQLYSIKIFEDEDGCTDENLLIALRYLLHSLSCDFINISAGIAQGKIEELHDLCIALKQKGSKIVSGFDNNGAVSYPAAFSCVYGVDHTKECRKNGAYIYVENSIVNFVARGGTQNVIWNDGTTHLVEGSSFSTPYVVALLAKLSIANHGKLSAELLKENAQKVLSFPSKTKESELWTIKRAVAFPFNKEIHALCRFQSMLPFQLAGVYNFKYLGNIGQRVCDVLYSMEESTLIIQNIESLDWGGAFDTFILGHVKEMCNVVGDAILQTIIRHCLHNHKNLYTFESYWVDDSIEKLFLDAGLHIYYPSVQISNVFPSMNKLYIQNTPSLTVLGTSSKEGKFSAYLSGKPCKA